MQPTAVECLLILVELSPPHPTPPQHLNVMNTEFSNYLNLLDGHNWTQVLNSAAAALVTHVPILVLKQLR